MHLDTKLIRFAGELGSFAAAAAASYVVWCAVLVYVLGFSDPKTGGPDGTFHACVDLLPHLVVPGTVGYGIGAFVTRRPAAKCPYASRVWSASLAGTSLTVATNSVIYPWGLLFTNTQAAVFVGSILLGVLAHGVSRVASRRGAPGTAG